MSDLILASTSIYRRQLLTRLGLEFSTVSPETDETPLDGESPSELSMRLAVAKAGAVAQRFPKSVIIGSDQVACSGTMIFGKPLNDENARAQLRCMSSREVVFHTAVRVLDAISGTHDVKCVDTRVGFRELSDCEIENYLSREDVLQCAGSAKSEGLGISLLSYIRGDDPNALIGLPLIALCGMLRDRGFIIP